MASIPVFDISNPLTSMLDDAVGMGYVNESGTAEGNPASFETNIKEAIKGKFIIDQEEAVEAVNIILFKNNIFDQKTELGRIDDNTGLPKAQYDVIRSVNYSPCIGGETYYIHVGTNENICIYWYDIDKNFLNVVKDIKNTTIKAPDNACYLKIRSTLSYGKEYKKDISINYPATDTEYHKYEAVTRSVTIEAATSGFVTIDETGAAVYDDGEGNETELQPIDPIESYDGLNHLFCDTGSTECVYYYKVYKNI